MTMYKNCLRVLLATCLLALSFTGCGGKKEDPAAAAATVRYLNFKPEIAEEYIWSLLINGVLGFLGVDITFAATYGFWGLVILTNWQLIGYMMVIYIAGLQNIPGELTEAAAIDGADGFTILWRIKLPMVMPSVTICTFLTLTNAFKMFDQNLALTAGAPERQTQMLALNIYQTFYGRTGWQGVGQAKAVMFFLLVAALAVLQLGLTRSREVES